MPVRCSPASAGSPLVWVGVILLAVPDPGFLWEGPRRGDPAPGLPRIPGSGDRCHRIRDRCSVSSAYTRQRGSMSSYPGPVQCVVLVHPAAGIDVVVSGTGAVCRLRTPGSGDGAGRVRREGAHRNLRRPVYKGRAYLASFQPLAGVRYGRSPGLRDSKVFYHEREKRILALPLKWSSGGNMRRGGLFFVNLPVPRFAGRFILCGQQTAYTPGGRRDAHVALPGSRSLSI